MKQLGARVNRWLRRLGREGVIGLGLLLFSGAFYLSAVAPVKERLAATEWQARKLGARLQRGGKAQSSERATVAEQIAGFYNFFPPEVSIPEWLERIYGLAAAQGLELQQGEYRLNRDQGGRISRYQITLPVRGSYLQLRKFLAGVLNEIPIASLDQVRFEKQRAADATIEAQIKLTLFLAGRE